MRYMKCGKPLDEVDDALRCMCLRWATVGSAEKERNVEEKGGGRDGVAVAKWFRAGLV